MTGDEFRKHVIEQTGRKDLADRELQIIKQRDELIAIVERDSGLEEAERRLVNEEAELEERLRTGRLEREAKLKTLDLLSAAEVEEGRLSDLHLAATEARFHEQIRQFYAALDLPVPEDARPPGDDRAVDMTALRRTIHAHYIDSQRTLVKQLRRPLSGYRARKRFWTTLPVLEAVATSLFIFCIGAGLLGELVPGLFWKIAFATAVWAAERTIFERLAGPWFRRKRCRSLEEAIVHFHDRKAWALHMEAYVDHTLDDQIKQHKLRLSSENKAATETAPVEGGA